MKPVLSNLILSPVRDGIQAMDAVLDRYGIRALPWLAVGMAASWWLYVPLHELFHAWGCLIAGGTVSRLEIDTVYGAAALAELFPYVSPGSEYAGRLSGFDTGGSDAVYLNTVFFPYLLTILIGVPVLHLAARRRSAWLLGAAFPWAYTPFLSLTGDFYEIGSILVSRVAVNLSTMPLGRWRSDDLPLLAGTLFGPDGGGSWLDFIGLATSLLTGVLAAFLTYAIGHGLAKSALRG